MDYLFFSIDLIFVLMLVLYTSIAVSLKVERISPLCFFFFPFSLPSLRPMLDVNYLPVTDMRIARTFCFTNEGQALYLVSPTEIQRLTYSQEMCDNLQVGQVHL